MTIKELYKKLKIICNICGNTNKIMVVGGYKSEPARYVKCYRCIKND